jgi:aminoglycoside phosphotransferase (APT) family kinase protein
VTQLAGHGAGRRSEPLSARAVVRATGVASAALVDRATLEDASRSHTVTRVSLEDGRSFVVKQVPADARAAGRSLVAELYTYRLASWLPGIAAALPRCIHIDERRQVLVLEAAPADQLLVARIDEPGFPEPALGKSLGECLAMLHKATTDVPLVTVANCGVIGFPDAPPEERRLGEDSPAGAAAIAAVCGDDELTAALRHAAGVLTPGCLIHGDVKWDNVIMAAGPPPQVQLFDWELSGRGDPAWDVGSALAEGVSFTARRTGLTGGGGEWFGAAEASLLTAYATATVLQSDFADRVTASWCARTIHLALEAATGIGDAAHPAVLALLEVARALHRDAAAVTEQVRNALSATR